MEGERERKAEKKSTEKERDGEGEQQPNMQIRHILHFYRHHICVCVYRSNKVANVYLKYMYSAVIQLSIACCSNF